MSKAASALVESHLQALLSASELGPILDLACGGGRNGLFLVGKGVPVVFADRSETSLEEVRNRLDAMSASAAAEKSRCWLVDFENKEKDPLAEKRFGAIIVFNYLHRALFTAIKGAIAPGGIVIYETFTVDNLRYGRPRNPDYLLRPGELAEYFGDWDCLHHFEGEVKGEPGTRAIAQIVARKPNN